MEPELAASGWTPELEGAARLLQLSPPAPALPARTCPPSQAAVGLPLCLLFWLSPGQLAGPPVAPQLGSHRRFPGGPAAPRSLTAASLILSQPCPLSWCPACSVSAWQSLRVRPAQAYPVSRPGAKGLPAGWCPRTVLKHGPHPLRASGMARGRRSGGPLSRVDRGCKGHKPGMSSGPTVQAASGSRGVCGRCARVGTGGQGPARLCVVMGVPSVC